MVISKYQNGIFIVHQLLYQKGNQKFMGLLRQHTKKGINHTGQNFLEKISRNWSFFGASKHKKVLRQTKEGFKTQNLIK